MCLPTTLALPPHPYVDLGSPNRQLDHAFIGMQVSNLVTAITVKRLPAGPCRT